MSNSLYKEVETKIFKYLNDNSGEERGILIRAIIKKFRVKEMTARTIYYAWKSEYMNTKNCIPADVKKIKNIEKDKPIIEIKTKTKKEKVKTKKPKLKIKSGLLEGEYIDCKIQDGVVKVGKEVLRNISDLEEYKERKLKEFNTWIGEIAEVLEMIN